MIKPEIKSLKNLGGRPRKSDEEKKVQIYLSVRPCHLQHLRDYAKMLNSLAVGEEPPVSVPTSTPISNINNSPLIGVIKREGKSIKDGIIEVVKEPVNPQKSEEPEVDYTLWQGDPLMRELDRAVCYETDGYGYPECAEPIARSNKMLWARAHNAKALGKTDEYNMIMTELWEKVK